MRSIWPLLFVLLGCLCSDANAGGPEADVETRQLLQRAEVEQVQISPDGKLLGISRRGPTGTVVSIHRSDTLEVVKVVDPGKGGEVDTLLWIDDQRLLLGVNVRDPDYGMPLFDPTMIIVRADVKDSSSLPANFLATIDDDPDHLLVISCSRKEHEDCLQEVRRVEIGKTARWGELIIAAPDVDSTLFADQKGNVRFAVGTMDDASTRTYVHAEGAQGWTLINDSSVTGLEVGPFSVAPDGKTGYLISERKTGGNAVESYDFATGKRVELYRNPGSDPGHILTAIKDGEPIGARFQATMPEVHIWNKQHPDAAILRQLQDALPGRLPSVVSATKDGKTMVVFVSSDRDAGAFYLFQPAAGKLLRVARSYPWLDPEQSGTQRGFQFAARDGVQVHGLLTLPPKSAGKKLPTVVLVHGGPYGVADYWGFDVESQILARHGYAVLQVNFRGSAGYGREFIQQGVRQWGRAMQDDITDATKWAIAQGIADGERICISGASYGGYSALMGVIREPALYQCAVGVSGVFDLAKLYKWGDTHRSDYGKAYLKIVIGEDQADLAARSPSRLADQIGTPVLLAHGVMDPRADVKHAYALENALKKNGKQVELIVYPRMGHSMMIEEQRQDFFARMLQFLDKHIGGKAQVVPAS